MKKVQSDMTDVKFSDKRKKKPLLVSSHPSAHMFNRLILPNSIILLLTQRIKIGLNDVNFYSLRP